MNKTSGLNYTIDITKPDTITGPTIVLSEAPYEVKNATSSQNVYKTFDYYTNEVSGKYANVNLIGGDIQILSSDFETGETPEEAETIFTELTIKQGTSLNKRTYIETQNIELDGLVFVAHYKKGGVDLEPVEITDYSKLEYTAGPLTTSTEYVRVSYTDLNTTRYVDITRSFFDVTNLALDGLSYNVDGNIDTEYYVTQSFDISNITFREHFNNGTTSDNAIPHTGLTITPVVFTDEHIGDNNTVIVSYLKDNGETASVEFTNIKVVGIEQTGIEVSPTKIETQYYAGQTLTADDKNLLTVSKVFNYDPTEDNENNAISLDDVTISYQNSEANAFEAGDTKFYVNYGTFSHEVEINPVEAVVHTGFEVSMSAATQSTYYVGDKLNFDDYSFKFTNNDGSKVDFTSDDLNNLSAPIFTSVGTQDVTVTYSNDNETFTVVVKDVVVTETKLESISLKEGIVYKNTYIEDEEFDPTGIFVIAHYNDTRQDHEVTYEDEDLSFNATVITKGTTLKAIYKDKECEIPLTINDKTPTELRIKSGTVDVEYVDGDPITTDGLTFEALYDNGKTYDVTGVTVSPTVASMSLTKIKFSYSEGDKTVELEKTITVTARAVDSITLNETEATLNEGGTLQLTATVNPSNATNKNVTWSTSDSSFATVSNSGLVTAVAAGEATITATAEGKTATCKINVNAAASPMLQEKTYTFSSYPSGTQYAEETHKLDDDCTLKINECYLNGELRIYSSSTNNGYAIFSFKKDIKGFSINAGNKTDTLLVYTSTDGEEWVEDGEIVVTSTSYNSYEYEFEKTTRYIKFDVKGSEQIRIKSLTIYGYDLTNGVSSIPDIADGETGWRLVKTLDQLGLNDKVIISSNSNNAIAGTLSNENDLAKTECNYFSKTKNTINGVINESEITTLTVAGFNGKISLKNSTGKYLGVTSKNNVTFENEEVYWKITNTDGSVELTYEDTNHVLAYNPQENIFTAYDQYNTSNTIRVQLYKWCSDLTVSTNNILPNQEESETPSLADTTILTYANTGSLSNNVISWTQDGVTVKNTKGSTAIRTSDTDHYRLYKDSTLEVLVANNKTISEISFTCTTEGYANVLKTSLENSEYNVLVSENVVTVNEVGGSSISCTISAQTRTSRVVVKYSDN